MQFWSNLEAELELGRYVWLAMVVSNTRHSPGTWGARMFVSQTGDMQGTIGGGSMEVELVSQAREAIRQRQTPQIETLVHRKSGEGKKSGMICAGEQTNLTMVLGPEHLGTVSDLALLELEDRPGVLRIDSDGCFEVEMTSQDRPLFSLDIQAESWAYSERIFQWKRVAIMGGGHCGLALSEVMNRLGYVVSIFDTRANLPTLQDNLWARWLEVVPDYADAAGKLHYAPFTHVVVMTTDMAGDIEALWGVWKSGLAFPYVGVMGSAAKIRKIRQTLIERGVSEEFLDSLRAPIGLKMKSNRPEEIAISVAAEILQLRDTLFDEVKWPEAAQT